VGMAAAVLIFIWVQNEYNFDTDTPDAANIYRIKSSLAIDKANTWVWESSPFMLGEETKKQLPEVEAIDRVKAMSYLPLYLNVNDRFFPETKAAYVDAGWFNMFNYTFISGGTTAFNQNPHSLIITETKAKKYFANQDPIGKTLKIDSINYQVGCNKGSSGYIQLQL
jgi:putative ABC transport system permease protein